MGIRVGKRARPAKKTINATPSEAVASKRVAIYSRLSRVDETVVSADERDDLYRQEAIRLGYDNAEACEDANRPGCYDAFLALAESCRSGGYDVVILFDLSPGFARWNPYERKLGECGVECVESRVSLDVVREKSARWLAYCKRERAQKSWRRDAQTAECDPYER